MKLLQYQNFVRKAGMFSSKNSVGLDEKFNVRDGCQNGKGEQNDLKLLVLFYFLKPC